MFNTKLHLSILTQKRDYRNVIHEYICLTSLTRAKLNDKMAFPA